MKTVLKCTPLLVALAFTGCATIPQQPKTFDQLGQFTAYPLNSKTYRIGFQAGQNLSYGTAEEITLLKAAQTTLKNGYRYFTVVDDPSNARNKAPRQTVIYPSPSYYPYGYYRRHPGFWPDPFYDMPQVVNIDPIQVSYTIECFKTQDQSPDAFDAQMILQSLGSKYGLSPSGDVLQPAVPTQNKK